MGSVWTIVALFAAILPPAAAATDAFPGAASAYIVEVDGRLLWSRAADTPRAPASLTKLMTALLVAEAPGHAGDVAVISPQAAAATGSRAGLHAGDRLYVRDLLAAALIGSANDACRALAEWRDGDEARFVARMNARAVTLGLKRTHFRNACGHDAVGHESSAADLAGLAQAAMAKSAIASLVRRIGIEIATVDGRRRFRLSNRNALIGRYNGAIGVKSGFTARAGKCLIALAERDGARVLLVLLDGRDRWWDAHRILDRAFDHIARAR